MQRNKTPQKSASKPILKKSASKPKIQELPKEKEAILEAEIKIGERVLEKRIIYKGDTMETVIKEIFEGHKDLNSDDKNVIYEQLKKCFEENM